MNRTKIIILGAGESGVGSAILAKKKGFEVFVSDKGKISKKYKNVLSKFDIECEEGKHDVDRILDADEVIKSPGIPDKINLIKQLNDKVVPVISEIEFASRYTKAFKICISGSNGKTTTSLWIYHMLKTAGLNVGLAGNIGQSFAWQVAENEFDYYVLELSSFQLDGMFEFKAEIAILMNITPDHLDRYEYDFQKYVDSKFRIIRNQTPQDAFIYCMDDLLIEKEIKKKRSISARSFPFTLKDKLSVEGAFIEENKINININSSIIMMTLEELALQGKHNTYNSMASGIASRLIDIRKDTIKQCLSDFQNVEHRLEHVATIHEIEFVNDSKATNINSTWYALESMTADVVWIVGGVDKGNDYSELKSLVREKVKAIVCLGLDNSKIHQTFVDDVEMIIDTRSIEDAVNAAYILANNGDVVLLSPACASFDLFENYEDRGNQFKAKVNSL
jgi:UDP-N-acetylmuramoylalanine--D-glutamate ligase